MPGLAHSIAVVAPASRLTPELAERVTALAKAHYGARLTLFFHPQCFLSAGHFAGDDAARRDAFVAVANDPAYDAVWIGRGGYGSCRIAAEAVAGLDEVARRKTYLGYSDAGALLAALYRRRIGRVVHGPMPADLLRDGGARAVLRSLRYLVDGAPDALEPSLGGGKPAAAFNLTVLSSILGTPLEPDLSGHVLMIEDVSEHMYRIDRTLFHLASTPAMRSVAGLRLGRCSDIPENDPDFGLTAEEVARHWCGVSGIAWLGRADIGHDVENKVVPFG
ncbi:MAG: LD-carboxypeptidase [Alphaproteobacteria bacterium]|nr:LD-carboxypeptidase [Alphaproteobacteria bacterium]